MFTYKQPNLALNQMPCRPPMKRVDFVRHPKSGKEIVVPSVDLADTVHGY